jgi:trehalose 6-phosphate phosphatase
MKYLLSEDSLSMLTLLAGERTLCAFDFDGTLAPIVADPDRAAMRARTSDLLRRLASLYPCIVLSGRARADLLDKLKGVVTARVIGSHGADTGHPHSSRPLVEQWRAELETALGSILGLWIEDKGFCLAVHYRQCAQKAAVRRSVLAAVKTLKQARIIGGKQVVNVVSAGAPNKGDALASERDRLHCNWVLYAGDDENDEDAFALGGNVVSVRVGRKLRSNARYYLRTQAEIDKLLDLMVRLRKNKVSA